jgi:hypothetical protein
LTAVAATAAGAPKGSLQPTYIAGMWRRGGCAGGVCDGLFASVMNPFGLYGNASAAPAPAPLATRGGAQWDVEAGEILMS